MSDATRDPIALCPVCTFYHHPTAPHIRALSRLAHPNFHDCLWTVDDQERADAEGWNIYEAHGVLEIERNDSNDVEGATDFLSDDAAVMHVMMQGLKGSEFHLRAFAIHARFALMLHYDDGQLHAARFRHRFNICYSLDHDHPRGEGVPAIDHYRAIVARAREVVELSEQDAEAVSDIIGPPEESYEIEL